MMGRFEREEIEARRLPAPLGTATEDLRSTIEAEVAKIVSRAEARADEIESQALAKAARIEQESEHRARDVFDGSRARVERMLAEIDAIERSVREAVSSLRSEAQRLTDELAAARSEPFDVAPAVVAAAPEPNGSQPAVEVVEEEALSGDGPVEEAETTEVEPAEPELREMIRQQLLSMAEGGRNRADAERMLLRFKQGELYFDLLDEIYPEEAPGRRGLLRRRKAR